MVPATISAWISTDFLLPYIIAISALVIVIFTMLDVLCEQ
jgi:hypothetical protein